MAEHVGTSDKIPQAGSLSALGISPTSALALRLTPDELEWLYTELNDRAEEKRCEAAGQEPMLAVTRAPEILSRVVPLKEAESKPR
jgi:hypothetical protein